METLSRGAVDPWWVTGLVDGEGSFTYNRNGVQVAVVFQIKMTGCERPLLERIQEFFGAGRLYDVKALAPRGRGGATKSSVMYRVGRHDELGTIVDHFDRYPLQSYKANAFKIWRGMVEIKRQFRGRNREALDELAYALSEAQVKNQTWR